MLNLWGPIHQCGRYVNRRGLLQIGALGAFGLTLPSLLRRAAAAEPSGAKARSAVLIFLSGGPSHHDTFDPKPEAPAEIRGAFEAISTAVPGVQFSEALPQLAAQVKRFALLRAVTHRDAAHEPGVSHMNTGYKFQPGQDYPGIGAVAGFVHRNQSSPSGLPSYVAIPSGHGGGHLGPSYSPFSILGDPNDPKFRVQDLALPATLATNRFQRRRDLSAALSESFRRQHVTDVQAAVDKFTTQAYHLVTSPQAQAALDVSRENDKTRDRYGRNQFGQRLLLARRLVEAGVGVVTASDFAWDDHLNIFPNLKQRLPAFDQGLSAFLVDLDERGLLDSTLVIVMGEFGRTPKINANRGRDHWANAFSVLLAGGGVRGGQTIGASDKDGAYPLARPVAPEDLIHSIYVLLAIDPTQFLPSASGRDIQIVRDGAFIKELTS